MKLGIWLRDQRQQYRLNHIQLKVERRQKILLLVESRKLDWSIHSKDDLKWNMYYQLMLNNDCNMP